MNDVSSRLEQDLCEVRFESDRLAEHLVQVSLKIEHSVAFKSRLLTLGVALPSDLAQAVLSRQCEFLAGRACALRAMGLLGAENVVQPQIGPYREPLWPDGYHGSITHTATWAASIVTTDQSNFLGIDRQEWLSDALAHSLAPDIVGANEHIWSSHFSDHSEFVTTVFSAKESLFKAMFPSIQRYVDFSVAELSGVDTQKGKLRLALTQDLSTDFYKGKHVQVSFSRNVEDVETRIIERSKETLTDEVSY
ncbi:4'-phosphopantetheinyl transferase [Vibrio splendidus]